MSAFSGPYYYVNAYFLATVGVRLKDGDAVCLEVTEGSGRVLVNDVEVWSGPASELPQVSHVQP